MPPAPAGAIPFAQMRYGGAQMPGNGGISPFDGSSNDLNMNMLPMPIDSPPNFVGGDINLQNLGMNRQMPTYFGGGGCGGGDDGGYSSNSINEGYWPSMASQIPPAGQRIPPPSPLQLTAASLQPMTNHQRMENGISRLTSDGFGGEKGTSAGQQLPRLNLPMRTLEGHSSAPTDPCTMPKNDVQTQSSPIVRKTCSFFKKD